MHEWGVERKRSMIVSESIQPLTPHIVEASKLRCRTLENGGSEMLEVVKDTVTVTSIPGGILQYAVTANFHLVDAFWCDFPAGNPAATDDDLFGSCICLIGKQVIQFCPREGSQIYAITLPFPVSKVLPSPLGLIMEKERTPKSASSCVMFPHLFSLSHPYNELLPIVCRNKDDERSCHYALDPLELEAVNTLEECGMLLCYSRRSRAHSLHVMREVTKEEWKCAAAKTESLITRSTKGTPAELSGEQSIVCSSLFTTPRSRPRIDWQEPTHVVCTRSMTAAAASFQSLHFSTSSRVMHSRLLRESAPFRSRGAKLEASPRLASFYREHGIVAAIDMRGSELELIAPEICMESIWIEPHRRQADDMPCKMPATIAFFTTDLIGQNFVCFYSSEWEILKCVRIISHDDGSFTAIRGFTTIKCISATNIKGRRLMAVVEKDHSTVLYTGVCRLGTLYVQHTPIEHSLFSSTPAQSPTAHESASSCCVTMCAPVRSVYPFRRGHFIVEGKDCVYSICRVAPSTSCNFVDECLEHVCSLLPNDRALKFASSWVLANNWRLLSGCRGNRLSLEMALFIQFLLSKCGVNIHNFPYFSEIEKLKVQCASSAGDAKKKRTAMADRSSLWEYMLSRESADTGYAQTETKRRRQYSVDISEEAELHSHARFMLSGLHASYEHAKMDTRLAFLTPMMASALHALSTIFALPAYVKYYREDFADLVNDAFEFRSDAAKGDLSSMRRLSERVPSLHGSVLRVLEERCLVGSLSCPTKCLPIVVLIAIGLGKIRNTFELQRAVGKNWEKKLGLSELDASFLFDTLDSIRGSPGDKCRSCARLFNVSEHFLMNLPPSVALLVCEILYDDRLLALNFFCPVPVVKPYRMLPSEEEIYRTVRFRWKYDMRFTNAMQMLDSSHPIFIPANNGVSEMEQRDMQEQMLTVVNMRTLTQCFGRAAIEFRHLVPPMNMPLSVPELCLQGRLHPCNMPFEMQHTEASKVMIEWGAFYNGVAAGLRVGSERSCNLDGEWLALSVSEQKGSASAGMIYAFGLNGHMAKINLFTIHELLSAGDRLMSASVLLGYAANMLATGDRQIYKVLVTHLPFMMGPTLLELHIDPMVQTAALVGLGLLFAKSSHLGILSLLLNEIGKPAPLDQEPWTDRYSYTLAVGFAVGLISLGQGEQLSADIPFMERYPSLQSRLLLMMEGGPRSLCVFPTNAPTDILPPGTTDSVNANVPQMSNHVMEFDNVNPHLSMALGLMYLRTGNETVAKRMRAPTTLSKLEKIRPDLLLLRTLCQSLIMWNQIEPSEMYVEELVPSVLRQYVSRFFEDELILVDEDASYLSTIVDLETIARSYLNIVAGACFAIAIRYASSFCRGAFETIMRYLSIVMPEGNPSDANMRLCHAAGPTVCAAVLNQLVYSLALVMAGSGDLEVLRLCRVLRRRVVASNAQKDVALYSTQVAANTAIGLIMIGKGRYALATNDLSVAALVIAFFPVAPHSISDNRTYLQPLRFLWSLSAEERLIDVVDAQTEEPLAKAAVNILFKRSNMRYFDNINGPSPIILPQPSIIEKIIITCENYEGRSFHLRNRAHWEALKNILRTRHGSLPLTRIGKVRCEEKRSGDSNKGSDVVDSDLKNLSDAEFDEMEMENECRTTIAEMGESSNSSSSTHTLQQIEFEEQRKSDWTPSYADDVDRLINSFTSIFGTDDAHSFLQHYIKDIIEKDDTRFPRVQCREVTAFLERCERKRYEPTAIASHLAASVSCLP